MKKLDLIAWILLIIGGINWGFVGVVDFNIIDYIFGKIWIDKVLYFLVGVSAIYALVNFKHCCKKKQN
ncbi:MAG: DUF378 domain-containing protein [Chlamydiae bacterium RIFCSPHIGHO2_12_FULL_27_8]|nr:MAG: DUF378 domain-containing protein [Chlamydiae bacterium RIFCSPHIGHO2_12_FULL_27_8]OGN64896.1 MAG: DUF378 domain-containing protein [Chlamydiae bacterium RIFCSPLOWO2_01_FULL_28_7]